MDYLAAFSMLFWWGKPTRSGCPGLSLPGAEDGDRGLPLRIRPRVGAPYLGASALSGAGAMPKRVPKTTVYRVIPP